jgi:vacuolar-type H+-ATPase subunit E/Vma4
VGIEELRFAVKAAGRERVAAVLRKAEAEAASLRGEADTAAAKQHDEVLAGEEAELRRAANASLAATRLAAKRGVLEARDALLGRVFERAAEVLPAAVDSPSGHEWLVAQARLALSYVPEGPVAISCSSAVVPVLAGALRGREGLHVESDDKQPLGFRLSGAGGRLTVDVTLSALLELHRPQLAIGVLQQLEASG